MSMTETGLKLAMRVGTRLAAKRRARFQDRMRHMAKRRRPFGRPIGGDGKPTDY